MIVSFGAHFVNCSGLKQSKVMLYKYMLFLPSDKIILCLPSIAVSCLNRNYLVTYSLGQCSRICGKNKSQKHSSYSMGEYDEVGFFFLSLFFFWIRYTNCPELALFRNSKISPLEFFPRCQLPSHILL